MTTTFKRPFTLLLVISFIRYRILYFKTWRLKESRGYIEFSEIQPNKNLFCKKYMAQKTPNTF